MSSDQTRRSQSKKAEPKHKEVSNRTKRSDELDEEFAKALATSKMEYKRRLIEHGITKKALEREEAGARKAISDANLGLDKVTEKGKSDMKAATAKVGAAKTSWEALAAKAAGFKD